MITTSTILRPVTMETRCCQKKSLNFKDTRHKISVPLAMSKKKTSKKNFQTFQKKTKKKILGRCWAKIGLRKNQPNVNSKRGDSESSTNIDLPKQRLRPESELGALVRGSDSPSGHSVHKPAGDTWRAQARRLIQINLGAAV